MFGIDIFGRLLPILEYQEFILVIEYILFQNCQC